MNMLGLRPELIISLLLFGLVHTRNNETLTSDQLNQLLDKWQNGISISRPKYNDLTDMLHEMKTYFKHVFDFYSIGISKQARTLWAIKMSMNVVEKERKLMKPLVKHVANIHGNEALGRSILLLFAVDLLRNYNDGTRTDTGNTLIRTTTATRARAMRILNEIEVHIVPSVNPDGFEMASNEDCGVPQDEYRKSGGRGRRNSAGVDLNRDFPDPFLTPKDDYNEVFSSHRQPETLAIMKWIVTHPFVLSTNFHSGAMVASYGYDAVPGAIKEISSYEGRGVLSLTPDHEAAEQLAYLYASSHKRLIPENDTTTSVCGKGRPYFENGITNGAMWYDIRGSMQDFNYAWSNCIDTTIEASCCKFPKDLALPQEWEDNKESLYTYTEAVLSWGFKGIVTNKKGEPVHAAKLYVKGNSKPVLTTRRGEYWRILSKNTKANKNYTAYAEFYGCESESKEIDVGKSIGVMPIVNFTVPDCHAKGNNMKQNNFLLVLILLTHFLTHFKGDYRTMFVCN